MPGANYMGGRRNAARARLKDVDGKTQRGYFEKQRHLLLTRALQDGVSLSTEDKKNQRAQKREEISFAHAQRDPGHDMIARRKDRSYIPFTRELEHLALSFKENKDRAIKQSKLLEKLDNEDSSSLRITMNKLLRVPDLAGLSGLSSKLSRQNVNEACSSGDRVKKRQRTESPAYEQSNEPSPSRNNPRVTVKPPRQSTNYTSNPSGSIASPSFEGFRPSIPSPRSSGLESTCTAEESLLSDAFSTMLECGTPDYSSFSELTFSDVSSPQMETASKIIDDNDYRAPTSLPQRPRINLVSSPLSTGTRLRVPRRSSYFSPSDLSQSSAQLPVATSRQTFTSNHLSKRKLVSTYSSSSPANKDSLSSKLASNNAHSQVAQDEQRTHNFISLLEVEDPWRLLDNVLGLEPTQTIGERGPYFGSLNEDSRAGLGFRSDIQASLQVQPTNGRNNSIPLPTAPVPTKTKVDEDIEPELKIAHDMENSFATPTSQGLDKQHRTREIVPLKRRLLDAASIYHNGEPLIISGTAARVLESSSPPCAISLDSPPTSFPSPPSHVGAPRSSLAFIADPAFGTSRPLDVKSVPSVSETVRQMLLPPQTDADLLQKCLTQVVKSSPPNMHLDIPPEIGSSHKHAEGPELFAGMDDD